MNLIWPGMPETTGQSMAENEMSHRPSPFSAKSRSSERKELLEVSHDVVLLFATTTTKTTTKKTATTLVKLGLIDFEIRIRTARHSFIFAFRSEATV